MSGWLWGTSQLDEAIDKATSELLPSGAEDIALNLEICDQIRSKSAPAKDAMRALKRRLNHKNPNVQLLALSLSDICIKNGGDHFLVEIASRDFMDNLVSILKFAGLNIQVKDQILRHVQNWSVAFEGKPALGYVGQVYKTLKNEGFTFPPQDLALANSAMVSTMTAPEWIDSEVCLRCRTAFSFTNRKHHCRNCGQVFDQQCSSKTMALPHFGITQEVRVCDSCYNKLSKKAERSDTNKGHRHSTSLHSGSSRHKSARELADAELQRAIQLSLEEVGSATAHNARPGYVSSQPTNYYSEPPIVDRSTHPIDDEENDPELKAAIEASLREAQAPRPSAPLETPRAEYNGYNYDQSAYSQSYPPTVVPQHQALQPSAPPSYDLEPIESDVILTFSQTVEQVQSQGGLSDNRRYPAVNELYDKANSLRPKLAKGLDEAGRKTDMLEEMHDRLSQAVKLYDRLLTEQVGNTSSRYQQPQQNQAYNAYAPNQQWAPQPQQQQYAPQQQQYLPEGSQQHSHYASAGPSSPPVMNAQPSSPPIMQPLHTYNPEFSQQYASAPPPVSVQPYSHPVSIPQSPPPTQPYTQLPPSLTRYDSQTQARSTLPVSAQHTGDQYNQYRNQPSIQHQAQTQQQQHAQPQTQQQQQQYVQPQQPSVPQVQSPPPQPQVQSQQTHQPQQPQQIQQPQQPQQIHQSQQPQQIHQPQQFHQPQQQYAPSAPPALPQFPTAPTSAPQIYSLYDSSLSVPSGPVEREERKEALLIEL